MSAIVVVVKAEALPGQAAALREVFVAHAPLFRAEDGCERYDVHAMGDAVVAISRWRDVAALDAHGKGKVVISMRAQLGGVRAGTPEVMRMTPLTP